MRTLKKLSLLIVLLMSISACMPLAGQPFPVENVKKIEIGVTTKTDVLDMFGAPWRTGLEDGFKTWTYGEYTMKDSRDLLIRFDETDKVKSYSFSSSFPEDKDL